MNRERWRYLVAALFVVLCVYQTVRHKEWHSLGVVVGMALLVFGSEAERQRAVSNADFYQKLWRTRVDEDDATVTRLLKRDAQI